MTDVPLLPPSERSLGDTEVFFRREAVAPDRPVVSRRIAGAFREVVARRRLG